MIKLNNTKVNIDINKYPVRRSNPIVVGSYGLPKDTERYVIKGQGLIGIDFDKWERSEGVGINHSGISQATFSHIKEN